METVEAKGAAVRWVRILDCDRWDDSNFPTPLLDKLKGNFEELDNLECWKVPRLGQPWPYVSHRTQDTRTLTETFTVSANSVHLYKQAGDWAWERLKHYLRHVSSVVVFELAPDVDGTSCRVDGLDLGLITWSSFPSAKSFDITMSSGDFLHRKFELMGTHPRRAQTSFAPSASTLTLPSRTTLPNSPGRTSPPSNPSRTNTLSSTSPSAPSPRPLPR